MRESHCGCSVAISYMGSQYMIISAVSDAHVRCAGHLVLRVWSDASYNAAIVRRISWMVPRDFRGLS